MSCIQQNFPSKFEPNDAFYEMLEENTFVAFILKHPVYQSSLTLHGERSARFLLVRRTALGRNTFDSAVKICTSRKQNI